MRSESAMDIRGVWFEPLHKPFHLVSLVPSWTETLFYLGLTKREIEGRTDYCIHPRAQVVDVEKLGGPRDPVLERILELDPDLIIMDREENRKEDVELLEKHWSGPRVFVTGPKKVDHALNHVEQFGFLLNTQKRAQELIENVRSLLGQLLRKDRETVAYLTWLDPMIVASRETYIGDVLQILGYRNVFPSSGVRDVRAETRPSYPVVTLELLVNLRPDAIFLPTEPFPFRRRHIDRLRAEIDRVDREYAASVDIRIVNGEYFSWYGSRMIPAFRYFVSHQARL